MGGGREEGGLDWWVDFRRRDAGGGGLDSRMEFCRSGREWGAGIRREWILVGGVGKEKRGFDSRVDSRRSGREWGTGVRLVGGFSSEGREGGEFT